MNPNRAVHLIGTREQIDAKLRGSSIEPRYYTALLTPGVTLQSWTENRPDGHTSIYIVGEDSRYTLVGLGYRPAALGQVTPLEPAPKSCPVCHGYGEVVDRGERLPAVPLFAMPQRPQKVETCGRCGGKGTL